MCLGREFQREGASVAPGPVLGPEWMGQEVSIRGAEPTGCGVVVERVREVGGGLVMEGLCEWGEGLCIGCVVGWAASGDSGEQGWCDHGSGSGWAGSSEQQNSGCTVVYSGLWMMCHREYCCNSRFWRWWIRVSAAEGESDGQGTSGYLVDVVFKGEPAVKHDSEVVMLCSQGTEIV